MAIVKMKKLRVMTMASQRDELLRGLLHLGCVEISEPDGKLADPAWAALLKRESSRLVSTRNEIAYVNTALAAIKKYAQVKDGMFMQRQPVSEEEFLGRGAVEQARTVSRRVGELLQTISRLQSEESRLLTLMNAANGKADLTKEVDDLFDLMTKNLLRVSTARLHFRQRQMRACRYAEGVLPVCDLKKRTKCWG